MKSKISASVIKQLFKRDSPSTYPVVEAARTNESCLNVAYSPLVLRILGHVEKRRSQRRIDVMSINPRKLSAVLS